LIDFVLTFLIIAQSKAKIKFFEKICKLNYIFLTKILRNRKLLCSQQLKNCQND